MYKKLSNGLLNKYKQAIVDELNQTFDDEKRMRFNHMLSVLNAEKNISSKKDNVYGVNNYDMIYEKMNGLIYV